LFRRHGGASFHLCGPGGQDSIIDRPKNNFQDCLTYEKDSARITIGRQPAIRHTI
jgi:hypothetical protein